MSGQIDLVGNAADLERLRVAILRLTRRIRASGHDEITPTQRSALGTIYMFGPLPIGQIAEREHVQPPAASKVVSTLEQLGYIERNVDPADRRCSLIGLTPAGRMAVERIREAGLGFLAARLAKLDDRDVDALDAALPALEKLLDGSS